jgi:methionyl-tRNA synthetase
VSRFFVTTAIDYANGEPHLGHALEKIGADAIARLHRQLGYDVHLLIGMDEHGQKVAQTAAECGNRSSSMESPPLEVMRVRLSPDGGPVHPHDRL